MKSTCAAVFVFFIVSFMCIYIYLFADRWSTKSWWKEIKRSVLHLQPRSRPRPSGGGKCRRAPGTCTQRNKSNLSPLFSRTLTEIVCLFRSLAKKNIDVKKLAQARQCWDFHNHRQVKKKYFSFQIPSKWKQSHLQGDTGAVKLNSTSEPFSGCSGFSFLQSFTLFLFLIKTRVRLLDEADVPRAPRQDTHSTHRQ